MMRYWRPCAIVPLYWWLLISAQQLQHIRSENLRIRYTDPASNVYPLVNNTIIGGFDAGAKPWFAFFDDSSYPLFCGASLIHGDILITAAHCVTNGYPGYVRVGADSRFSGGVRVRVVSRIIHPDAGSLLSGVDIALLKLGSFLSNDVLTINSNGNIPGTDGEQLFVLGMGLVDNNNQATRLQGLYIDYIQNCGAVLNKYDPSLTICANAMPAPNAKSTCGGDSGGPVLIPNTKTQVGIVSFGNSQYCDGRTLVGYVRLSTHYSWLQDQVCSLSNNPPSSCFSGSTPRPTPRPTNSPNLQPSSPVSACNNCLTAKPTLTSYSTPQPTPTPTAAPVSMPLPTPGPTAAPVSMPLPTPGPTAAPVLMPQPTPGPTATPVLTPLPTPGPTAAPVLMPQPTPISTTDSPSTISPSRPIPSPTRPTTTPGQASTPRPTPFPTPSPTPSPTPFPTPSHTQASRCFWNVIQNTIDRFGYR